MWCWPMCRAPALNHPQETGYPLEGSGTAGTAARRPAVDVEQRVRLRPSRRRAGVCHLHRPAGGKRRRGVGLLDVHPDFAKEEFTLPGIGSCPGDVTLWPQRMALTDFTSAVCAAGITSRSEPHDRHQIHDRASAGRLFKNMGQPAFRAKQVFTWLHRGVRSFDEMTDLSKPLRAQLAETCFITAPTVARKQTSKLDGTVKYLWELADGNCIETVLMQYHHGNTVCISSQVGCRMGCAFCASTIAGRSGSSASGAAGPGAVYQLDSGLPVSNIVLMGIGEPLDNMDNVLRFFWSWSTAPTDEISVCGISACPPAV